MVRLMMFAPLGDAAVVVTLGRDIDDATMVRVRALVRSLERANESGIVDVVPAYTTVTVYYDAGAWGAGDRPVFVRVCDVIGRHVEKAEHAWPDVVPAKLEGEAVVREEGTPVEIPVCYGGEYGPDLEEVAAYCGLGGDEVVALHSGADYVVHAVGFAPGFAYLGGLPEKLRTPRKATPRTRVPAGSVGIGWMQTGIYPLETPGGWQLIGRTPLVLFDSGRATPALLSVGDRVKFRAIGAEEFAAWK
jgi:TIGR00370 family protein